MHQLNQWQNNYSVFVKELDDQHKELIGMLNELYNAYLNNLHHEKIQHIISLMTDYANIHFATEEKYFKKFEYLDAELHICEHEEFMQKVMEFQVDYRQNNTVLTLQVIEFLRDWLNHHILEIDRKYISCFNKGGLK
jgi:hemerythrin